MKLRPFLQKLEEEGRLSRIKKEVSIEYEIANVMNSLRERPVIFDRVQGHSMPVFGGIVSSRDLIAQGLGTTREKILEVLVQALRSPLSPSVVEKAPCQEVIVRDVDLSQIPFLLHLPGDGGRYTSATIGVVKDPDTGQNLSYHRMMVRGKDRFTARLIPHRQMRTTYEKVEGDLEVAFIVGNSTNVLVAASLGPPAGIDEMAIANALEETPVVKCITKDLVVPADAEMVLEGRFIKETDKEGPFVDLTETWDFERREPVFVVDCITHRKDAMYQALLPGRLEHKLLMGIPKEPTIYDEVSKVCSCKNVVITLGGGSWFHGVVQIEKKDPQDGKRALDAAFKGHKSMKHCMVVDTDVDIYDPLSLEWALATRFQADKDAIILRGQPGSSLDPSGDHSGQKTLVTKVGLDCTIPAGVDPKKYQKVSYEEVDGKEYLQ